MYCRLLEVAVKSLESSKHEHIVVGLLEDLGAPVPGRGQTAVNARTAIVPGTVETVLEEIR